MTSPISIAVCIVYFGRIGWIKCGKCSYVESNHPSYASTSKFNPIDFYGKQMYRCTGKCTVPNSRKMRPTESEYFVRDRKMEKTFAYYLQGKWLVHNQLNKINRLALCLWIVLAHISVVWFQVAWALVLYVSWGITPDRYNNDISRTECEPFNF